MIRHSASRRLATALLRTENRDILIELAARAQGIAVVFGDAIPACCEDELWVSVPGFEGKYEASTCGRVRSLIFSGGHRRIVPRLVKPALNGTAPRFRLGVNVSGETKSLHRVVAMTFIGPRPAGLQINHKNGNWRDNHVGNLEYVTPRENVQHAWRTGLAQARRGAECWQALLTDEQAAEILESTESGAALARKFGVTPQVVSNVRVGRTWRHLPRSAK